MLEYTDRHARYLFRLMSRHALLYTEMVTTGALLHGKPARWLDYSDCEHPLALQLGGSDPSELAACVRLAAQWRYDEVNLNVGCPSDRVQNGRFGACLMAQPDRVADCVRAMREAADLPVTVKTRIGIDHQDSYEALVAFIATVADGGCDTFIIHARKAWLSGLNPKQNREIPPLRYETVYRLKRDFPGLAIIINGGLNDLDQAKSQLAYVDGVMLGRAAYHNAYLLSHVDSVFYGEHSEAISRAEVISRYQAYVNEELERGTPLRHMTRHLSGLVQGVPGARRFRRYLSENVHGSGASAAVISQALDLLRSAATASAVS